jgi:putative ABC transport system permease protein
MVLLLLGVVRGDLLDQWRASVPRDAPNLFLVNIQPDETAALAAHLEGLGVTNPPLYPMVRGRLVGHNAAQVTPEAYPQPRASRLVAREFNLSFMHDLPEGNAIDAGHWWDGVAPFMAQASVETGLAETLGIGLGDRLRFQVAEREVEVTVTSLRRVAWDSFRVNFFVIMPPGVLDAFPATYITSLHLPPGESAALGALVRRFPSVTAIDVDALLGHLTRIIDRVTLAVELVFGFTLLAGLAVLYAAIHSTLDDRRHEAALLRTLGARRRTLLFGLAAEFVLLGTLAGLLGALGAAAVGWLLATRVFELPYHAGAWLWLLGPGGGALVVGLSGLLGTWRTVDQPPLQVLRRR